MPFDGAMLYQIKKEIIEFGINSRVEKIYQPSKEELLFVMRQREGAYRLFLTSRANCPRVHFTAMPIENPQSPPMFCMLLRKLLQGAWLTGVSQPELERVLRLEFSSKNELGDKVKYFLVIEIMSRHSNIILLDQNERIIDSVKRVNDEVSQVRQVLPNLQYASPPAQHKLNILTCSQNDIMEALKGHKEIDLSKAFMNCLLGISPLISREIASYTTKGADLRFGELKEEHLSRLSFYLERLKSFVKEEGTPLMLTENGGKPFDFTFMDINQYGIKLGKKEFDTFSQMLDDFYKEKDVSQRMLQYSHDLFKILSNANERIVKKINLQNAELAQCKDREQLKIYGDLINSNLYVIKKGDLFLECENYYDNNAITKIPLDASKTPVQNAQKYYKNYKRAQNAENHIKIQLEEGRNELVYIESVVDSLSRAETLREFLEIKTELTEQGYIKKTKSKTKLPQALKPIEFTADDGMKIFVGRNNKQNDLLTLKQARNCDIWLHVKSYPGSHTVIETKGEAVSDETLAKAAQLAAHYSKVRNSDRVAVDYTLVRYVNKPSGAKPGMVIYTDFKTIYVKPQG